MKICMVHNEYGKLSGEEIMVSRTVDLLQDNGHEIFTYFRKSSEIKTAGNKVRALLSGIYSRKSRQQFREIIKQNRPDIIQVQNVYPLISPSVLVEAKRQNIPVVMRCANYRLICPNGLLMTNGRICEKCCGGQEYWCIFRNCEKNYLKSLGYALRNYIARKKKYFLNYVTAYYAQTEFQKQKLIAEGYPAARITVIPNMVDSTGIEVSDEQGEYIGYVGRISPEKGLQTLVGSARACSDIQFKAAGSYARMPQLPQQAPNNSKFLGHLNNGQLGQFYNNSRMIVLPSIWYEGFPSVVIEAMLRQKPVICSHIGGLPEIVEDGVTGLLFEPGNADELAEKIRYLWDRPELCRKMGRAGREKALREYSPEKYYERLMAVYEKAMAL